MRIMRTAFALHTINKHLMNTSTANVLRVLASFWDGILGSFVLELVTMNPFQVRGFDHTKLINADNMNDAERR